MVARKAGGPLAPAGIDEEEYKADLEKRHNIAVKATVHNEDRRRVKEAQEKIRQRMDAHRRWLAVDDGAPSVFMWNAGRAWILACRNFL